MGMVVHTQQQPKASDYGDKDSMMQDYYAWESVQGILSLGLEDEITSNLYGANDDPNISINNGLASELNLEIFGGIGGGIIISKHVLDNLRGWTIEEILNIEKTYYVKFPTTNNAGQPCTAYFKVPYQQSPGGYVVINNATKVAFAVGNPDKPKWITDKRIELDKPTYRWNVNIARFMRRIHRQAGIFWAKLKWWE